MPIDREAMKKQLLNRTKQSYDRRDGGGGSSFFKPDVELPFYKPQPTTGKPHIVDILPFQAGGNFPTKISAVREGDWEYHIELWVHKNVGPGKATVVCPARNYGNRCPVCEDIDDKIRNEGLEYEDISYIHKHQCVYNVLVMDDAASEEKGVQLWSVSYKYSEKAITTAAVSARDGGLIPFANPDKELGKSLVFDVAKDKYRTISGHRFEARDYDIPDEILEETFQLDQIIQVFSYDELCKIFYGETGKPAEGAPASAEAKEERTGLCRSLRGGEKSEEKPKSEENKCPVGAVYADDHDKYEDCKSCDSFQACAEAADLKEMKARKESKKAEPEAPAKEEEKASEAAPPASSGRRILRRLK